MPLFAALITNLHTLPAAQKKRHNYTVSIPHDSCTFSEEAHAESLAFNIFCLTSDGAAWSILRTVSVSVSLCPEHGNRNAWECYFTHPLHLMRSFCQ